MQLTLHFFIVQELQEWLCLTIKKQNSKILSKTFEWWILKRQVWELSGIANIPQKRHQTVRQIRLQMEHISMRSCIHTKWNQLSPGRLLWQSADNQMVQTVRREACGASYQTKRTQNIFMLSYPLTYSILLSPTSQRLAVLPFSPERETCCMLPICRAFAFLPFIREYSASPLQSSWGCIVLWTPAHTALHPLRIHTPVNLLMHTDNKQSSRLFAPPFFQKRSFVFCFSFGKTFASLAFIREHSALRRQSPQDFTAPSRRLIFHTPFPVPL